MVYRVVILMIDVLKRITELREQKKWSEYQLAEHSGLTQSTISSWYKKDILPTLPSLDRICDAFGITISQLFYVNENEISLINHNQKRLLEMASKLEEDQLESLINFLEKL